MKTLTTMLSKIASAEVKSQPKTKSKGNARITPRTIEKRITSLHDSIWEADYVTVPLTAESGEDDVPTHELAPLIETLRQEMQKAARELEFERAADLRDRIGELEEQRLRLS